MRLAIQCGHGMMAMNTSIMEAWGEGTVILSPKNVAETRIIAHSRDLIGEGASTLFDPQFYFPAGNHPKLRRYRYWPGRYDAATFWAGNGPDEMIGQLLELNVEAETRAVIVPAPFCENVTDGWLDAQENVLARSRAICGDRTLYATLPLGADALRNNAQVHTLLDDAAHWPVEGIYFLTEHRGGAYLVDDASWMANALDIAASFRLRGRRVIWGYCNQQQILAACAAVDEIGIGTWMNGRMFKPDDFRATAGDTTIKQRSDWYYAAHLFSEYQPDRLDIANAIGVLDSMRCPAALDSEHAEPLFAGGQPSASGFREGDGFLHYLCSMRAQAGAATRATFEETVRLHQGMFNDAERQLNVLRDSGITSQRDFRQALDANRGALAALQANRGALLSRAWARLIA